MRASVLVFVALTASLAAAGDAPPTLPNIDPLLQPAPKLEAALQYTPDTRPAAEKIVPLLHQKLGEAVPGDDIKVIVTLVDPKFTTKALPGSAEHDAVRARHIAALEHKFVGEAESFGFQGARGLKHSPIVFGWVSVDQVESLASLPFVRAVEYDLKIEAARTEGGNLIKSPQIRTLGGRGNGIGVAVLDTGIAWNHPELSSRVTASADYTATQSSDFGYDDHGHGTASAGIVAGTSGGMAPQAHVWALKVLDSSNNGSTTNLEAALDAVYENRNDFGGVRVVNISIGGRERFNYACDSMMPSMATAMSRVTSAGIPVFTASGNHGCTDGISFPACISHAISVGAVYDANVGSRGPFTGTCISILGCTDYSTAADKIACYSNSGDPLDILAPADCAETPWFDGSYYPCYNGTSAAAPYASGAAAQILSLRPSTTPAQLRTALKSTGKPITDAGNGLTRRRIDAQAAYQYLVNSGGGGGGGGNGQNVASCGNAFYDDGTTEGTAWFGGGKAGDPNFMFAVRFSLADFGFSPGSTQITKFCASNQGSFAGGPWPNQVFVYPNKNGLPDNSRILAQGTVYTGDGRGWYEVTLDSPVTLSSDFWLVMRGDPQWSGEDFNMDYDDTTVSGHSLGSDAGIGGLAAAPRNFMLRATLQNSGGGGSGSCTNSLTNGVVCLRNRRFEFTGTWTDFANPANTKPLIWTPVEDINATGGFQNNPSGIQVVMRVADGCSQTGTYWVWLGGFTDAGWSIRVRDTVTGRQKTFNRTRQSGAFPTTLRDATTFPCN